MGQMMDLIFHYAILEQIEDSIVIKEYHSDGKGGFTGGEIRCASRVKAEHYNLTIPGIIGKTDFDLLPFEQAQKALEDDLYVMKNKVSIQNMAEIITYPNGETVRKSTSKSPFLYSNKEVGGVICISRYLEIITPAKVNANGVGATHLAKPDEPTARTPNIQPES